jgi:hypothetical protein
MAATEKKDEAEKKPGEEDENPAVQEMILEKAHNPEEAREAEHAIRSFVRERLQRWYNEMEAAIDRLEAWILAQPQEEQQMFSERGFFDSIGDRFQGELLHIAGGRGTPVMDAIVEEVDLSVESAQHNEFQVGPFLNEMRRGLRDACWYMRDACQAILSNQWADLLDLATRGSMEFIPALFQMGLPSEKSTTELMAHKLTNHADEYRKAIGPMKDAVADKSNEKGVDEEKKLEAEEEAKDLDDEELDETKKESQQAVA